MVALGTALLAACGAPARAGSRLPLFDVGVRAGANVAMLSFDTLPPGVTDSHRFGYVLGGSFAYPLWPMGDIETGLVFSEQGGEIEGTVTVFNQSVSGKGTLKLTYLTIPLLLKVSIPAGRVTPYAKLGPQLGIRLASKIELEPADASPVVERDLDEQTSSTDWALYFAAGIEFSGEIDSYLELGYGLGLTKAVEGQGLVGTGAAENQVISVSAGFLF